ncbi:MAG: TRAP transporter substrate-binding protein [Planctomycetales bacterium]|nr:TRAP transporter substrate-binding protein [Planctomycetales bacterium]
MWTKSGSYFFFGLLLGVLLATCGFGWYVRHVNLRPGGGNEKYVLKLAHSLDQSHPVHKAMAFMADTLKTKSAGTVELQIFPNGQLGSETECIEQLQRGALAMTKTSTAPMESFIPDMAIFGIPYVFRDEDHFWKMIHSAIGKRLLTAGESVGLRGLCYYDAGARSFYTTDRPVMSPNDLKGLKIRVQQSKTAMDMVEALGGAPTPIAWGELYTALQQGMVDGAENNPPSFFTNRHFEVCKHLSLDEHTRVPDILLFSEKVWEGLPGHVQQWIQEAADESATYQRKLWSEENEAVLQSVVEEGVTIHYPDKSEFASKVAAMHGSYEGSQLGNLLQQVLDIK